jgi:peptidoglycan/xylan/chitin deacetylase (PgdA/CDA1 family)
MATVLLEILCGTAGAAAGLMAYGVRGRSSTLFGPSVYRGPAERRAIALTFDDGPSESTPELLNLMARHGAAATFFQCGANVERLPAVAREVAAAGHEIGNHSYSHPRLYFRSASSIYEELRRGQEAIAGVTGRNPVWFRAPYGARWPGMRQAQRRLGLTGVMWTAIGLDWKLAAGRVVSRLLQAANNGAIFCLHDGRGTQAAPDVRTSLEAARRLVPELQARGFRLETVSQLVCPKN